MTVHILTDSSHYLEQATVDALGASTSSLGTVLAERLAVEQLYRNQIRPGCVATVVHPGSATC